MRSPLSKIFQIHTGGAEEQWFARAQCKDCRLRRRLSEMMMLASVEASQHMMFVWLQGFHGMRKLCLEKLFSSRCGALP
ncbi:unnamed protein product [Haemonchus placei]|uniref:Uncharacterized protein n=1 Tax=Haemonchus placei TaxID=6290 RepID=A0A0N4WF77_HAEPC|nr:unnamed protein product [Haemonchus placei]